MALRHLQFVVLQKIVHAGTVADLNPAENSLKAMLLLYVCFVFGSSDCTNLKFRKYISSYGCFHINSLIYQAMKDPFLSTAKSKQNGQVTAFNSVTCIHIYCVFCSHILSNMYCEPYLVVHLPSQFYISTTVPLMQVSVFSSLYYVKRSPALCQKMATHTLHKTIYIFLARTAVAKLLPRLVIRNSSKLHSEK